MIAVTSHLWWWFLWVSHWNVVILMPLNELFHLLVNHTHCLFPLYSFFLSATLCITKQSFNLKGKKYINRFLTHFLPEIIIHNISIIMYFVCLWELKPQCLFNCLSFVFNTSLVRTGLVLNMSIRSWLQQQKGSKYSRTQC